MMTENNLILNVKDLSTGYEKDSSRLFQRKKNIEVLHHIHFGISRGEILGLVGESGCGKTTLSRAVAGLIPFEGEMTLDGETVTQKRTKLQRKKVQIIFQDPYGSLNPKIKIGKILEEPLIIHKTGSARERAAQVDSMLEMIQLGTEFKNRYPSELSGGQRQRVSIGCALMLHPLLLIADEAVSALDVSIQAQILNLLKDLHDRFGLSYLFISHNLDVVYYLCDRIAVMYRGDIVEIGISRQVCDHPAHPYTRELLAAGRDLNLPDRSPDSGEAFKTDDTSRGGCPFYPGCPNKTEKCKNSRPPMRTLSGDGRSVSCHNIEIG